LLAAAAGVPLAARAFGDASLFIPAVAQHAGRWDVRATGLRRLAWEVQRRTSVEVSLEARAIPLDSPRLFEHPFLYLSSDEALQPFTDREVENLRRYLTFGGFLFADANDASQGSGFDASFRRELARVLPRSPLTTVQPQHVLFKTFYLLESAPGRVFDKPSVDAALLGQRAAVLYSQNDVLGALARDEGGGYEFEVSPGGERQRELATRVAVNVVMYALCLDYKDDAVHMKHIMERRR
jgi:hypothetical protein